MDYRDAIAQQLAQRRRTGGIALPQLPPLGTSPAAMARATPVVGTPAHRPPAAMAEANPFTAAMRAANPYPDDPTNSLWERAVGAVKSRWNAPDDADLQQDYIYGDRVAGPR